MNPIIGSKTLNSWEKQWLNVGFLNSTNVDHLKSVIGVFAIIDKKTKEIYAVGAGTEFNNGGLKKRLMDFIRQSDSARSHYMGKKINKHLNKIEVLVIKTGNSINDVVKTYDLRNALIKKYNPIWNLSK